MFLPLRSRQIVYIISFIVAVLIPSGLVIAGKNEGAWLLVLAGIAGALLTRLDDIEIFSIGPLKAQLTRAIIESNATVDQLRNLGLTIAKPTLRIATPPSKFKYDECDAIIIELKALGVLEKEIISDLTPFYKNAYYEHMLMINNTIMKRSLTHQHVGKHAEDLNVIMNSCITSITADQDLPIDQLLHTARISGFSDIDIENIIDLEFYVLHKKLRRPDNYPPPA